MSPLGIYFKGQSQQSEVICIKQPIKHFLNCILLRNCDVYYKWYTVIFLTTTHSAAQFLVKEGRN